MTRSEQRAALAEMRGYTTNYVNLIADNLRDRYDNGFPILKELIQNADDAKEPLIKRLG